MYTFSAGTTSANPPIFTAIGFISAKAFDIGRIHIEFA